MPRYPGLWSGLHMLSPCFRFATYVKRSQWRFPICLLLAILFFTIKIRRKLNDNFYIPSSRFHAPFVKMQCPQKAHPVGGQGWRQGRGRLPPPGEVARSFGLPDLDGSTPAQCGEQKDNQNVELKKANIKIQKLRYYSQCIHL